jgi:hypothetical protein
MCFGNGTNIVHGALELDIQPSFGSGWEGLVKREGGPLRIFVV